METNNKKLLVLGDTHGHDTWKSIIDKESPSKIIFLGDYFDCHDKEITSEIQVANFVDILNFQEEFGIDNCILLIGNHDFHYITNNDMCSGFNYHTKHLAKPILEEAINDNKLAIIHIDKDTIYSHAGVSNYWFEHVCDVSSLQDIGFNNKFDINTLCFNYIQGYDGYGDTISNSPIWIRPKSLIKDRLIGYKQVVGHTPMKKVVSESDITFCDTLPKDYLIVEDYEGNKEVI